MALIRDIVGESPEWKWEMGLGFHLAAVIPAASDWVQDIYLPRSQGSHSSSSKIH